MSIFENQEPASERIYITPGEYELVVKNVRQFVYRGNRDVLVIFDMRVASTTSTKRQPGDKVSYIVMCSRADALEQARAIEHATKNTMIGLCVDQAVMRYQRLHDRKSKFFDSEYAIETRVHASCKSEFVADRELFKIQFSETRTETP